MATFDIFNDDAFTLQSLIDAMDRHPFKPSLLKEMGFFTQDTVRTETVSVEWRDNMINLVNVSERGGPLGESSVSKRKLKAFYTNRLGKKATLRASELQFVRQMGTEDAIINVQQEIARRLGGAQSAGTGIIDDIDLTMEHMRLGAIQGLVVDKDGSVVNDWTAEFDTAKAPGLIIDYANIAEGDFRKICNDINRYSMRESKGMWMMGSRNTMMCGDDFFDSIAKLAEVRERARNAEQGKVVQGADAFDSFSYGNIDFINFRGTDDGSTVSIPTDEARLAPRGVPGLFSEVFAPGEKFSHIGQLGEPMYVDILPDMKREQFVELEAVTYPLHILKNAALIRDISFL